MGASLLFLMSKQRGIIVAPGISGMMAPMMGKAPIGVGAERMGEVQTAGAVPEELTSRLLIKTGKLEIVVRNIREAVEAISRFAERKGGWVVSRDVYGEEESLSAQITIRVPAKDFEEALAYIRRLAERVTFERVQGEDVTEEYFDLQARLRNLEAAEAQPAEKWRPGYVIQRAWRGALLILRNLSYVLLWIAVYGILWVPVSGIVWWVHYSWKRRRGKGPS